MKTKTSIVFHLEDMNKRIFDNLLLCLISLQIINTNQPGTKNSVNERVIKKRISF